MSLMEQETLTDRDTDIYDGGEGRGRGGEG